jgi:TIMELESS-interacting protein
MFRIRNPVPKLDVDRLMGARGVHTLEEVFTDFRPRGKGREFEDLDLVMKRMEHWAHRLYPKLPFDGVLDIVANRLGKNKVP